MIRSVSCSLVIFLIGAVSSVSAGAVTPEISIGVSADSNDKGSLLGTLEPNVKWSTSGTAYGLDYEGGVTIKGEENGSIPYSVWGKIKKNVADWKVSARLDTKSDSLDSIGVDLQAAGGPTDVKLQVKGKANLNRPSATVTNLKATQGLKAMGGTLTVTPSYNLKAGRGDISLSYGVQDTVVILDADLERQKLTVSQRFGDNAVSPSITTDGDVEIEYRRAIGETGIATLAVKPNSFINFKIEDGPWEANILAPMDGFGKFKDGVKVNLRRAVSGNSL